MKATEDACLGFSSLQRSRRDALRAGALTITGLGLPGLLRARAEATGSKTPRPVGFGRAKACILIFQWGGPSQLDTWDPKPNAPEAIRGSFAAIPTKMPGVFISEHFPRLAAQTHRLAIVRSMSHDDFTHLSTAHRVLTGHLAPTPYSDAAGPSPRDSPHLGAIVAKVRPSRGVLPSSVTMPWTVSHPAAPGGRAPGQDAGWLGKSLDPFRIEGDPNDPSFRVAGLDLPPGVSPERMRNRRALLAETAAPPPGTAWESFQARALDALTTAEAQGAFRIDREDPRLRDNYGRHIHGQCLLLARRLVESGVGLVTTNWHDDGKTFWDTHSNNFNRLKNDLMPPADRAFAALLDDLSARSMLDETLVVWVGEFGRKPHITARNAGREHWPHCYSAVLAGGGIAGGQVYGASDHWAAYPSRDPVSPDDLGATILHTLGIDPARQLTDPVGRPLRINDGQPVVELFA